LQEGICRSFWNVFIFDDVFTFLFIEFFSSDILEYKISDGHTLYIEKIDPNRPDHSLLMEHFELQRNSIKVIINTSALTTVESPSDEDSTFELSIDHVLFSSLANYWNHSHFQRKKLSHLREEVAKYLNHPIAGIRIGRSKDGGEIKGILSQYFALKSITNI
jgi:hypothetical protein